MWRFLACLAIACGSSRSAEPPPAPAPPPSPKPTIGDVVAIAAGDRHTCILDARGTIACWGSNDRGQLGVADRHAQPVPVIAAAHSDATQLAASGDRTCLLHPKGDVECWGQPTGKAASGIVQLRDACMRSTAGAVSCWNRSNELVAPGVADATDIAGSAEEGCAKLAGGAVQCWTDGKLAAKPVAGVKDPVELASGDGFSCARLADGHVACWGIAWEGRLGRGGKDVPVPRPTMVYHPPPRLPPAPVVGVTGALAIAAYGGYACAITADHAVRCWGKQWTIGDGPIAAPSAVAGVSDARLLALGPHACIAGAGHVVTCWGPDEAGQLGNGWTEAHPEPNPVPGVADAVEVQGSCARRQTGTVVCWGAGTHGVTAELPGLRDVASGAGAIVVDKSGAVRELYDGKVTTKRVPPAVQTTQRCAIARDGHAWCWGNPHSSSSARKPDPTPRQIANVDDAVLASDGDYRTCILRESGSITCLFVDDVYAGFDVTQPVSVPVVSDAVALASSGDRDCALRADHSVWCWTWDQTELRSGAHWSADGKHVGPAPPAPTPQKAFAAATAIAVGYDFACAVLPGGKVACTGDDSLGQLGGSQLGDAMALSAGFRFGCALRPGGVVACWGRTTNGDVGELATGFVAAPQTARL